LAKRQKKFQKNQKFENHFDGFESTGQTKMVELFRSEQALKLTWWSVSSCGSEIFFFDFVHFFLFWP
jgi:hypothetical protein